MNLNSNFILSRTPLRISFFGGGTDYPTWCDENRGSVLSTSIDKYIYLSCRYLPPFFGVRHRIVWRHVEMVDTISEILNPAIREGLRYLDFNDDNGIEIHYQADLPARTGMGSSSSFIVGIISSLLTLKQQTLTPNELASKAIDLEINSMKEPVGLQDQVAAVYGGLNQINFGPNNSFTVKPVELSDERKATFNSNLMLFYIGSGRFGSEITEKLIKAIPQKDNELSRMVQLVDMAIDELTNGDIYNIGEMLHESWELKRSLCDNISTPEIDQVYEAATSAGAIGGKLLGAGGTGFMLFFVPLDAQKNVRDILNKKYLEVNFSFDDTGSKILHQSSHSD